MTEQTYVAPTETMPEGFHPDVAPFDVVDTTQIQFQELLRFAAELGFEFNGKSFVRESGNRLLKAVTTLTFNRFVKIYQTEVNNILPSHAVVGKYAFLFFDRFAARNFNAIPFYLADFDAAMENRQLKKVKLQMLPDGTVQALSHMLKFLDPVMADNFNESLEILSTSEE